MHNAFIYMQVFLESGCVSAANGDDAERNEDIGGGIQEGGTNTENEMNSQVELECITECSDFYQWEGRHAVFSQDFDSKYMRGIKGWVQSNSQQIPYYVCALACFIPFAIRAAMTHYKAGVLSTEEIVDVVNFALRSIACGFLFVTCHKTDDDKIRNAWEAIRNQKVRNRETV